MSKHTNLPWALSPNFSNPVIGFDCMDGGDLLPICPTVHGYDKKQAKANAAFIVRCCNAHDDAVDLINAIAIHFKGINSPLGERANEWLKKNT